jgi:hypothetical protein
MLLQIMNLKNELRSISVDAQLLTEAIWDRYSRCWFFNQARNIIILRVLLGFFFSCLHITKLEAQVNLYRYLTQISPLKNVCMLNTSKFYHSNPIGFYVKTMSAHGSHLGWRSCVTGHNFESILPKDHPCHICFKLADWFQRRRLKQFSHKSYVKTMTADSGHFGPRSGPLNTILTVDHLRTIEKLTT